MTYVIVMLLVFEFIDYMERVAYDKAHGLPLWTVYGGVFMCFLVAPMLPCPQSDTMIAFCYLETFQPDQCELEAQANPAKNYT